MGNLCKNNAKSVAEEEQQLNKNEATQGDDQASPDNEADEVCSDVSLLTESLPFFAREGEHLKVLSLSANDAESSLDTGMLRQLPSPRAAAWSPDGNRLAFVDLTGNLLVEDMTRSTSSARTLSQTAGNVQQLRWSPLGTSLALERPPKGDEPGNPNVEVWQRANKHDDESDYVCVSSFQSAKVDRDYSSILWNSDERVCGRLLPDGTLVILNGSDLSELSRISHSQGVQAFAFAPLPLGTSGPWARICVFIGDKRDAMQRVIAPAEVAIYHMADSSAAPSKHGTVSIPFGQQADLSWSPSGTAVLVHAQTDVDDSGQSYYGGSRLVVLSQDAKYSLDLTEAKDSVVQAVSWCPKKDEFVLIQGFQPAQVTWWRWDSAKDKCLKVAVLKERAHRNTLRWNAFGSLCCIAGFGNLAGEVDFFGRGADEQLVHIASCHSSCAVTAEWAADGRHLMTAVLSPRMRVDNGFSVWYALTGAKVAELASDELLEVQWKPEPIDSDRFLDVSKAEIEHALRGGGTRLKKAGPRQAYRPPSARTGASGGAGSVAAMMRGEKTQEGPAAAPPRAATAAAVERKGSANAQQAEARRPATRQHHGAKTACPTSGWEYMDPKGKKQGPFGLEQMQKWYEMGAFKPTLKMRCSPEDPFVPLSELFPHPMVPFLRAPKRPA